MPKVLFLWFRKRVLLRWSSKYFLEGVLKTKSIARGIIPNVHNEKIIPVSEIYIFKFCKFEVLPIWSRMIEKNYSLLGLCFSQAKLCSLHIGSTSNWQNLKI